jgi:hypothetical protein
MNNLMMRGVGMLALVGLLTAGCDDGTVLSNDVRQGPPAGASSTPISSTNDTTTSDATSTPPPAGDTTLPPTGAGCVATIDFHDGAVDGLAPGPGNQVFLDPAVETAPVSNYESQVVFRNPSLSAVADFESTASSRAELALLPAGCRPGSLEGRTVHVKLIWRLNGAIGLVPSHGVSLGTYAGGRATTFSDANLACTSDPNAPGNVPDSGCAPRTLNTLNPLVLTHTFKAGESAANGLFLRVDLQSTPQTGPIPTTVYVSSVTWD